MNEFEQLSDEDLQKLAVRGNGDAENALVQRYVRLVKICARPYFLAGGNAEDLTQEGMLGLISAIRDYDDSFQIPLKAYAQLCIRRRIFSAIRSASGQKHVPLNDYLSIDSLCLDENQTHAVYSNNGIFQRGPEDQIIDRELELELITKFSDQLSKFEAEILRLYLEGLSYQEISCKIGKPVKAIDNAVQRIRKKLVRKFNFGDISCS